MLPIVARRTIAVKRMKFFFIGYVQFGSGWIGLVSGNQVAVFDRKMSSHHSDCLPPMAQLAPPLCCLRYGPPCPLLSGSACGTMTSVKHWTAQMIVGPRKYNDTGAKNTVKTRLNPKTRSNERKTAWTSMTCYDPTDV